MKWFQKKDDLNFFLKIDVLHLWYEILHSDRQKLFGIIKIDLFNLRECLTTSNFHHQGCLNCAINKNSLAKKMKKLEVYDNDDESNDI